MQELIAHQELSTASWRVTALSLAFIKMANLKNAFFRSTRCRAFIPAAEFAVLDKGFASA